jgi:hypothetical protein
MAEALTVLNFALFILHFAFSFPSFFVFFGPLRAVREC